MTSETNCPTCGHGRKQHSFMGCTWTNPKDKSDKCDCLETYMNMNPAFNRNYNKRGHA